MVLFGQPLRSRSLVFIEDPRVAIAEGEAGKERELAVWNNNGASEFYVDELFVQCQGLLTHDGQILQRAPRLQPLASVVRVTQ